MRTKPDFSTLRRLRLVALVAAAGALSTTESHAAVVYFAPASPIDISISVAGDFGNINTTTGYTLGSTTAPSVRMFFFAPERPILTTSPGLELVKNGSNLILKLASGDSISGASFLSAGGGLLENEGVGPWNGVAATATQYVGIRIGTTGNYNYGWINLGYDDASNTLTFRGLALETTLNLGITAGDTGAIPEPSSAALLLAVGAVGLAAYRRRPRAGALAA